MFLAFVYLNFQYTSHPEFLSQPGMAVGYEPALAQNGSAMLPFNRYGQPGQGNPVGAYSLPQWLPQYVMQPAMQSIEVRRIIFELLRIT